MFLELTEPLVLKPHDLMSHDSNLEQISEERASTLLYYISLSNKYPMNNNKDHLVDQLTMRGQNIIAVEGCSQEFTTSDVL